MSYRMGHIAIDISGTFGNTFALRALGNRFVMEVEGKAALNAFSKEVDDRLSFFTKLGMTGPASLYDEILALYQEKIGWIYVTEVICDQLKEPNLKVQYIGEDEEYYNDVTYDWKVVY